MCKGDGTSTITIELCVYSRSLLCILLPSSHPPFGDGITWTPLPALIEDDSKGKLHIV